MGGLDTVTNGKGDKPRPIKNVKQFNDNFDLIFNKKIKKTKKDVENKQNMCDNH